MANKFILPARKRKPSTKKNGEVIRISADAYNALIDMCRETTLPIKKVASMAIKYASDNLELSEEVEGDEE